MDVLPLLHLLCSSNISSLAGLLNGDVHCLLDGVVVGWWFWFSPPCGLDAPAGHELFLALDGASSCIRFCPGNLLLCNPTAFGSPAHEAPQLLSSELLGPAHRGSVSCVYIMGAAITHRQVTSTGSRLKKSTHRQAFCYSLDTLLPSSPSCNNWTFLVAWLLSTTVTLCHPPSLTRNIFKAHLEVLSSVGGHVFGYVLLLARFMDPAARLAGN